MRERPLIAHLIYGLWTGGLENMLVTLLNRLPEDGFRHVVFCFRGFDEAMRRRIANPGIEVVDLREPQGSRAAAAKNLFCELRARRPAILHTRSLGAIDGQWAGLLARIPGRIHGEHGRDIYDLDGTNRRLNHYRRVMRRIIHQYIAVSRDLADWLVSTVGVEPERVRQIYNGVDVNRFTPRGGRPAVCAGAAPGFLAPGSLVVGAVGRMVAVKDQATLVRAFLLLRERRPHLASRLRLLIVGDGPEREKCLALLAEGGALDAAWLPGDRSDADELLRAMDIFVLPSLAEGISNTILEAMATGLPVVATRVGGNGELVNEGETGELTPPRQAGPLAEVLGRYLEDEGLRAAHGAASRRRAEERFSLEAMVAAYRETYESVLGRRKR